MRLVHTSDWHVGKTFRFADDETLAVLQAERLEAIGRIGRVARAQQATRVLVAGDVWDVAIPSDRTLRQPIERMRQFPDLHWHLIPGNHDPNIPGGVWERLVRIGLPEHVHAHLSPRPVSLGADDAGPDATGREAWLLPAALDRRHAFGDPTACMDDAATPEGSLRIGLAHGSVRAFGSGSAHNLIAADRASRSGLDYLALGDWHGQTSAGPLSWYSGTPEPDGFDLGDGRGGEGGSVLLVGAGRPQPPTPHVVGRHLWRRERATLTGLADIEALEHRLRSRSGDDPSRTLVWLTLDGALGAAEHDVYEDRIRRGVGSALLALRIDASGLVPTTSSDDLAALGEGSALREAADRLSRAADPGAPGQDVARDALARLLALARQDRGAHRDPDQDRGGR